MPDLPAVNELVPGYTAFTWFGMWAPNGTPADVTARMAREIAAVEHIDERRNPIGWDTSGFDDRAWAQAVRSTHSPIGTIKPVSSASGMKVSGGTMPSSG